MTTTFTASGAADFLALVPRLTGFSPTRSLVLVPFSGNRSLGALRLDLPGEGEDLDRIASTAIGLVCKIAAADALSPVVYTEARFADGDGMPHDALVGALLSRADICGLRVVEALCVASDGWGSYLDPGTPSSGHPLEEILLEAPELEAFPVAPGDQSAGAALPAIDFVEKERVGNALRQIDHVFATFEKERETGPGTKDELSRIDPRAFAAAEVLEDCPALFEDALDWDHERLDPFDTATIGWCLARPMLRDIAITQWCHGLDAGDRAAAAQLRWSRGEPYPEELATFLWGEGPAPDAERVESALALSKRVAATLPRPERPGALATCGWLSWALGRSTHASRYAAQALEIDADHVLGGIVTTLVSSVLLPEWIFERAAARKAERTRAS